MKQLKLYFTSDLHGYVYPTDYLDDEKKNIGLLNCMNQYEKDGNTLIIDGGDTIQGSPFMTYLSGKALETHPMATIMNAAGYDYVTFGNHEFNYGYDYLKSYIQALDATCLCANITDTTDGITIKPYDIKVMENGLKVGIVGIATDYITQWERAENIAAFEITDVFDAVKKYHDLLKDQVDVLLGVYHGGFECDLNTHTPLSTTKENVAYRICKELQFDVLLTGHQHMPIEGQLLHGTYVVQTPHNGTSFIEVRLEIGEDGEIITQNSQLRPATLPAHEAMYETFLSLEQDVQRWLDTPVGHLSEALIPSSHLEMAQSGSTLANFINQIQLDATNADISCTSFANSIKGFETHVTVRDILSTYVYPNTLVVLNVTGDILKQALERCASYFTLDDTGIRVSDLFLKPKVEHYNYDYFANMEYTFDLRQPLGQRVTSMRVKGHEVKSTDCFTLVMNNYRASGAGGYEFFTQCKVERELLTEMPELIINYFTKHPVVTVDPTTYIHINA